MEEIAKKYLDCKTEKDYLDFIIYLYIVIDNNKDYNECHIDNSRNKLNKINFSNKLISLSHICLETLARNDKHKNKMEDLEDGSLADE